MDTAPAASAKERLRDVAYELFCARGVRDVGVDEIIAEAGVAKATLYKHYSGKDELVLAFLHEREQRWTLGLVEAEALRRGTSAREQLLAIFDVFDEWFHTRTFDGCSFINVLLEMRPAHRLGRASITHLDNIRAIVRRLADAADLRDVDDFTRSWHLLMKGAIISAMEGDLDAGQRAKRMAVSLIDSHDR